MLLCGDWVLPVSSSPVANGAVLVVDGIIKAVGSAADLRARHRAEEIREFPGCAILPGFINVHTHLDYSVFRGFASSSGFSRWILRLLLARSKLTAEDVAASALWGAFESVRNGVTTVADTSHEGLTVARAAQASGLRARIYLELFGLDDGQVPQNMERLEALLYRAERESGTAGEERGGGRTLVEWGISPHAPYTVSRRLYEEAANLARGAGLHLATHVAESRPEIRLLSGKMTTLGLVYKVTRLWTGQHWEPPRMTPVQYVDGAKALGPDMLVVHAVQVDDGDIAILADRGSPVAHCPRSNLQLRCGMAPVAELKAAGVVVGLGTDSLASNNSLDMLAEMRAAVEVSWKRQQAESRTGWGGGALSVSTGSAPALSPKDVLHMATLAGAQALQWEHLVGSLEAGKRADVVAVRLPETELPGQEMPETSKQGAAQVVAGVDRADPMDILAAAVMRAEVRMTMVDGKIVFEGGEIPAEVVRRFKAARARMGLKD